MASMQMCRPACDSTFSETEKVKYSSSSTDCYSNEHKNHEHGSAGYTMTQAVHHVDGVHQKRPVHKSNYSQGLHLSDHKHHENKPAGCATNQGGHHMGGMVHKQPNHSTGYHGFTQKIGEYFGHNGSSHGHKNGHGHQSSSYAFTEKKEEHKVSKTGHGKTEVHIKKKSSKKGKSSDDSSSSESDDEGCKKKF